MADVLAASCWVAMIVEFKIACSSVCQLWPVLQWNVCQRKYCKCARVGADGVALFVVQPAGRRLRILPENVDKMPESAWKLLYYSSVWSFTVYVVILRGKYRFFQEPSTVWDGEWSASSWHFFLFFLSCLILNRSFYPWVSCWNTDEGLWTPALLAFCDAWLDLIFPAHCFSFTFGGAVWLYETVVTLRAIFSWHL